MYLYINICILKVVNKDVDMVCSVYLCTTRENSNDSFFRKYCYKFLPFFHDYKKKPTTKNHNICKGHEWWCIQTRNLLKARFQLICLVWELTDRDAEMIFTFGGQWQPMLRGSFAVTWFTLTVGLLWPFSHACLIPRLGELRGTTQKFKWSAQGLVFSPLPNSPRVYTIWRYSTYPRWETTPAIVCPIPRTWTWCAVLCSKWKQEHYFTSFLSQLFGIFEIGSAHSGCSKVTLSL